jgi:hypothetical protein
MSKPNSEKFLELYVSILKEHVAQNPTDYLWYRPEQSPAEQQEAIRAFANRMVEALRTGRASKESKTIKAVCKALSLRHTYTAIESFLNS